MDCRLWRSLTAAAAGLPQASVIVCNEANQGSAGAIKASPAEIGSAAAACAAPADNRRLALKFPAASETALSVLAAAVLHWQESSAFRAQNWPFIRKDDLEIQEAFEHWLGRQHRPFTDTEMQQFQMAATAFGMLTCRQHYHKQTAMNSRRILRHTAELLEPGRRPFLQQQAAEALRCFATCGKDGLGCAVNHLLVLTIPGILVKLLAMTLDDQPQASQQAAACTLAALVIPWKAASVQSPPEMTSQLAGLPAPPLPVELPDLIACLSP